MTTEQITIKIEFENTETNTTETFVNKTTTEPFSLDTTISTVLEAQQIVNTQLTDKIKQSK